MGDTDMATSTTNVEYTLMVTDTQTGYITERESGLIYSGESGGLNEPGTDVGDYTQIVGDDTNAAAPEASGPMKESMETMKKAWKDASGDAFDFKAIEESEAAGTGGCTDCGNGGAAGMFFGDGGDGASVGNGSDNLATLNGISPDDGDGKDDFAAYLPDDTIQPGESFTFTIDPREPVTMAEHCVLL
jgi:hypothetical protein